MGGRLGRPEAIVRHVFGEGGDAALAAWDLRYDDHSLFLEATKAAEKRVQPPEDLQTTADTTITEPGGKGDDEQNYTSSSPPTRYRRHPGDAGRRSRFTASEIEAET